MTTSTDNICFTSLSLLPALAENLSTLGFSEMTPIQAKSLPATLAGNDVVAQAKTGSGKTVAFGLGLLNAFESTKIETQALVLCPTRELADQVATVLRQLARTLENTKVLTLCGGMPMGPQLKSLTHPAHIVVGTPGRVEEHLRKGTLSLEHVSQFVLDEADRMLDMGFQKTLDDIMGYLPAKRQTLLFSATYPEDIKVMAERVMQSPVMIKVEATDNTSHINQYFYNIEHTNRLEALRLLLLSFQPKSSVVFCHTKQDVKDVTEALQAYAFSAVALHGDLEQAKRNEILVRFSNQSCSILVATDVAARGLDIDDVDLVINYQLTRDCEVHVHRIGRTGRAGKSGNALTLVDSNDSYKFIALGEYLERELTLIDLPSDDVLHRTPMKPNMQTIQISAGKKEKLRPGDILGALTNDDAISGQQVGKIKVTATSSYVAVARKVAKTAVSKLQNGKMKGRTFRARLMRN